MNAAKAAKALVDEIYRDDSKWEKNFRMARNVLEEALEKTPEDPVLLTCYGAILSDTGHHRRAVGVLRKAVAISRDRNAEFNLGVALVNSGHIDEGREHMANAGRLKPHPHTWQAYFDPHGH
ncbi:MAG: UDP-N-acetylglucosamine-peptide N-acetylglucosaminyltransferase [Thermoanaerobaculia bacterium]|nr:UDP-N-acetylglucosamine-peptide N-acetylglucosaminyltransferase [Thermoanaerobaculia bacterium]